MIVDHLQQHAAIFSPFFGGGGVCMGGYFPPPPFPSPGGGEDGDHPPPPPPEAHPEGCSWNRGGREKLRARGAQPGDGRGPGGATSI